MSRFWHQRQGTLHQHHTVGVHEIWNLSVKIGGVSKPRTRLVRTKICCGNLLQWLVCIAMLCSRRNWSQRIHRLGHSQCLTPFSARCRSQTPWNERFVRSVSTVAVEWYCLVHLPRNWVNTRVFPTTRSYMSRWPQRWIWWILEPSGRSESVPVPSSFGRLPPSWPWTGESMIIKDNHGTTIATITTMHQP